MGEQSSRDSKGVRASFVTLLRVWHEGCCGYVCTVNYFVTCLSYFPFRLHSTRYKERLHVDTLKITIA